MNAHSSEKCGKSFKYLKLLKIHTKISHEGSKMYCHYFNNKKAFPFKEECVFCMKIHKCVNIGAQEGTHLTHQPRP